MTNLTIDLNPTEVALVKTFANEQGVKADTHRISFQWGMRFTPALTNEQIKAFNNVNTDGRLIIVEDGQAVRVRRPTE